MRGAALRLALTAGLVATLTALGCGYRLAGHGSFLPVHIKTIGIPPFDSIVPRSDLITEIKNWTLGFD